MGANMEMAKPTIFNGEAGRVGGFVTAYRSYIRIKMREHTVEEQVLWVLLYMQGGSVNIWKENIMEELESGEVEYESIEEFLTSLKKEFGGEEEESIKAVELRQVEQGGKTMEEFVQVFKRMARGSGYKEQPLIEEFTRGIRRKLVEVENPPVSIEQWYRRATALDRNWRESRREEERMRGKKEVAGGALRQEQRQSLPQLLVWQRRQTPQQATMRPALMEGVERMNVVVLKGAGQGAGVPPRQDPFAMEVDRGRNCYACRGFGHMACHCRNRGRGMQERKVEIGGRFKGNSKQIGHLKEVENLEVLN